MIAKLQHWSLRSRPLGEWQSPEDDGVCVFGFLMGHPRHCDGKEVLTSRVVRCQDNRIVTKSGSEYELGSPDPSYERSYPGALQRLFARLEQCPSKVVRPVDSPRTGVASLVKSLLKSFLVRQRTS